MFNNSGFGGYGSNNTCCSNHNIPAFDGQNPGAGDGGSYGNVASSNGALCTKTSNDGEYCGCVDTTIYSSRSGVGGNGMIMIIFDTIDDVSSTVTRSPSATISMSVTSSTTPSISATSTTTPTISSVSNTRTVSNSAASSLSSSNVNNIGIIIFLCSLFLIVIFSVIITGVVIVHRNRQLDYRRDLKRDDIIVENNDERRRLYTKSAKILEADIQHPKNDAESGDSDNEEFQWRIE